MYYVATESPEINIERIKTRIAKGGHAVSPDKIKERYQKSLSLLLSAIKTTDRAYIFDNSGLNMAFVAEITSGKNMEYKTHELPNWFYDAVISNIKPNFI